MSGERRPHPGAVSIGGRWIGRGLPVYLVAAAGSRHGDDLQLGYKLVETAGGAGAEAIVLGRGGLSERDVKSLFGYARHVGLTALGEAASEDDIDLLASVDVPGFRLKCGPRDLIERAVAAERPIFLDVCAEMAALSRADVALLVEDETQLVSLLAGDGLGAPAGYTHAPLDLAAVDAALALGACLIEAPHDLSNGGAGLRAVAARIQAWRPRAEASATAGGH